MKILDIVKLSFHHILCGGLKTLLCIFAVFAGVFAFCMACYAGDYAAETVSSELDKLGIKGIAFYSKNKISFTTSDISDISKIKGVDEAMPLSIMPGTSKLKNYERTALIISVDDSLEKIWNVNLLYGRTFSYNDIHNKNNVAIIDSEYAKEIYKRENVVGKEIILQIDGVYEAYQIIGIVTSQKKGLQTLVGTEVPEVVYIPYVDRLGTDMIAISCSSGFDYEEVSTRVQNKIREQTGTTMYYKNLDLYVDSFSNIIDTVGLLAIAFAAISLIVGGIGVMSNMLNKAEQRKYEIGVYISLGASGRDVCLMFLVEAVLICLIGGILGWLTGSVIFDLISHSFGLVFSPDSTVAIYGIVVSSACGVLFGMFPAIKAASMKPINAIRG